MFSWFKVILSFKYFLLPDESSRPFKKMITQNPFIVFHFIAAAANWSDVAIHHRVAPTARCCKRCWRSKTWRRQPEEHRHRHVETEKPDGVKLDHRLNLDVGDDVESNRGRRHWRRQLDLERGGIPASDDLRTGPKGRQSDRRCPRDDARGDRARKRIHDRFEPGSAFRRWLWRWDTNFLIGPSTAFYLNFFFHKLMKSDVN